MAQSNVNMSKLKRSFQMLAAKIPQRTICEQLLMGRGVLNRYKTLADSQGLSYGVIGRMSDGDIESFLQLSKPTAAPSSQRQVLDGLLPEYVSDLSPFKPCTSHTRRSIPTDIWIHPVQEVNP